MRADGPRGNRVFGVAVGGRPDARRLWRLQRELDDDPLRGQDGWRERSAEENRGSPAARWVAEAQAALGGRVFRVPCDALADLRQRIEALDRRAGRLGVAPIRLLDTGEREFDRHAFVVLHGAAPVLAGWTLEAIVEHHGERGTVRAVGELGEHLDREAFQSARCEHCGVRRRRSTTFVVVHVESGELRQVGSNCVRDFLGGNDPERACRQAEYLARARAELKGAEVAARPPEPALEAFAMHASHVVRAHGFISREQARCGSGPTSADLALRSLQATPNAPDAADRALAGGALRWAQALPMLKPNLSPFEADALAVINSGAVKTRRDRGLICALIAAYRQRRARSHHLAQPGDRLQTVVLVEQVKPVPSSRHGTVHRCELIDADVNRLAWWQTRRVPLHAGEVVRLAARVERHSRFGTSAVTVVSRCAPELVARPGSSEARPGT